MFWVLTVHNETLNYKSETWTLRPFSRALNSQYSITASMSQTHTHTNTSSSKLLHESPLLTVYISDQMLLSSAILISGNLDKGNEYSKQKTLKLTFQTAGNILSEF